MQLTQDEQFNVDQAIVTVLQAVFGAGMVLTKGQVFDMVRTKFSFDAQPQKQVAIMQRIVVLWEVDLL